MGEMYRVLIVEDSENDRQFLKKAIAHSLRLAFSHELADGDEAIAYFRGEGPYADRETYPLPDLLFLDLKMPRVNGFEVLRWLQAHPHPALTVIVLTASTLDEDVRTSLALGAHGYWSKTADSKRQRFMLFEIEALLIQHNSIFHLTTAQKLKSEPAPVLEL